MSRVEIVKDGVNLGVIDELQGTIKLTQEGERRMLVNAAKKGTGKSNDADDAKNVKKAAKKGQKAGSGYQYPPKGSPKAK